MTEKRTDLSRYKSPSTGDYCTGAQYIAEMMCQRMAENSNEGSLAYKFWNTSKWKKTYQLQIIAANRLVDEYDERAIIAVLKSKRGQKIYSLRFPRLKEMIEEQAEILKKQDEAKSVVKPASPSATPRKPFGQKSNLQKLRELDADV